MKTELSQDELKGIAKHLFKLEKDFLIDQGAFKLLEDELAKRAKDLASYMLNNFSLEREFDTLIEEKVNKRIDAVMEKQVTSYLQSINHKKIEIDAIEKEIERLERYKRSLENDE